MRRLTHLSEGDDDGGEGIKNLRRSKWLAAVGVLALITITGIIGAGNAGDDETTPVTQPSTEPLVVTETELVSQLTGPESPSRTDTRWNIYGADLGFSFEYSGNIQMVFGDTWGRDGVEGSDWRSNTMVTVEPNPKNGYVVTDAVTDDNGEAKELLSSLKQAKKEYTVMPTAGIAVDGRMYLHYMSVNDWSQEWWGYKEPVPNYSGFAYSDDNGQTWVKDEEARWIGDSAFAQAAMVKDGDYVYVFGTPTGRFGPAKLFRVEGEDLLQPEKYEYWTGDGWSQDANQAVEVVPDPVGELSVRWSPYHERWLMMYKNEVNHTIVLRTAPQLQGPWDEERVVVTDKKYPTLYAPFMLPITGPDIYFTMSRFDHYQVYVMRLRLEKVSVTAAP